MSRTLLGLVALVFLLGGGLAVAFGLTHQSDWVSGAVAVRVGAVLGVIWLALPEIRRTSPRTLMLVAILAVVVVLRPKLVLVALPVAVAVALLMPGRGSS